MKQKLLRNSKLSAGPTRTIADVTDKQGVRRVTLQHGPLPILPGDEQRIIDLTRTFRDESRPTDERLAAASAVAPYIHPRFEVVTINIKQEVKT